MLLGGVEFANNLIQGPLAGISCAPFRRLIWEYSKPAFSYTEMISCKTILYQPTAHRRFLTKDVSEGPVGFQLSGNDPRELSEAVKIVTDLGADLIDLNCGCPVNKIRSRGAGSALLQNSKQIYALIQAMKNSTHCPVSIKIRVDGDSKDNYNQDLINMLNDSGVDFVIVHGRHWTHAYDQPCNYTQIKFFVENLTMPVIGNGDIACIDSYRKMLATGCAGVMVSRATVGQPWLLKKLQAQLHNEIFHEPLINEIMAMLMRHVQELAILLQNEKFAVLQARKFAKYYARPLLNRDLFIQSINACNTIAEIGAVIIKKSK
jgi:tRNA-dihydrouridine synthase B